MPWNLDLNRMLLRLKESGIIDLLIERNLRLGGGASEERKPSQGSLSKLSPEHFLGVALVSLGCYALSTIVFAAELRKKK